MLERTTGRGPSLTGGEKKGDLAPEKMAEGEVPANQYEKLLQQYDSKYRNWVEGEIIIGRVVKVTDGEVFVDVGHKSEGVVPIQEVIGPDGKITVKPGDEIAVLLEQNENIDGYIILSKEKAERIRVWDEIEKAYRENGILTGRVVEKVKGGLSVDIGVRAFLPGSQIDLKPVRNLDHFVNQQIRVRILKLDQKKGNIVLSRKAVVEEQLTTTRREVSESLQNGKSVKGIVKNITEYGAFIDLGGIDGLIHITDMSWGRINHPSELFQVGDQVEVMVLPFDAETERGSLGLKQITDDPWTKAAEKYVPGTVVRGK